MLLIPTELWAIQLNDPEMANKKNPHWTAGGCDECHDGQPGKGENNKFKEGGDFDKLCNKCHKTEWQRAGEHGVGIEVKENERIKMPPADFPLPNGKLSCITCHDLKLQCVVNASVKEKNSPFVRRAPFEYNLTFEWAKSEMDIRYRQNRYGQCFYCHKQGTVLQWSPHKNQLDSKGEINEQMCLFCHFEVPDRNAVDIKDWKLKARLQDNCKSCHMGKTRYHPIRVTHYGNTMPDKIYNQIKSSERKIGLVIPMEADAQGVLRINCCSCHNPHQRGVLQNVVTEKGADVNKKLRVEGFGVCLACHGEAVGVPQTGAPF